MWIPAAFQAACLIDDEMEAAAFRGDAWMNLPEDILEAGLECGIFYQTAFGDYRFFIASNLTLSIKKGNSAWFEKRDK